MADVGDAFLSAYRFAGRVALPALGMIHSRRVRRGKEDPSRRGERFGEAGVARPDGTVVWVHAASVGETNAVLPLVGWLAGQGLKVLLTTGTVTSAQVAAASLPEGAIHQYAPYDVVPLVDRFLDCWRPALAMMVESEIWPATLAQLARRQIPCVVVSGRMSESSFRGWRRYGPATRGVFGAITLCLAQSPRDADRFRALGAPDVRVAGNIKFDVPPLPADPADLAALQAEIGERPVWLAASTHPGEEEIVGRVHAALRAVVPELLLICVPRHPERGGEVCETLTRQGHIVARRSRAEPIGGDRDVYVADTIGELGLFYRLAPLAFVGGSLVPHGGQNPIEPAQLGCSILAGPHVGNFAKLYRTLNEAGGALTVADEAALREALLGFLRPGGNGPTMQKAARDIVRSSQGALAAVKAALAPLLADVTRDAACCSRRSGRDR